ncbi:MAG TPA: glucoamylase family protein [Longimicrobiales bacterium]|nr:glucoamylase family protein [Longimicrobiales bacterium]
MHRLTLVLLAALLHGGCGTEAGTPSTGPDTVPVDPGPFFDDVQERTFAFFWETTSASNGLTPDRWPDPPFSSIAAVGFALTAYPVGVERGWVSRADAAARTAATLRFFRDAPQHAHATGVTGYRGFFYHFLDMSTGERSGTTELSTIDTALLLGGVLAAQQYFDGSDAPEPEIREMADSIYRRVEWDWAAPRPPLVALAWSPEEGFSVHDWRGYNEAMLLYILALGSPTYPVDPAAWGEWTSTYRWVSYYGQLHVNFGPLFGHQYSHVWIDFRGIRDAYMRQHGIDYFENSRRATLAQQAYAMDNPGGWLGYGEDAWGLTASDGPGSFTTTVGGRSRTFRGYWARGAAATGVNDDGTLVPTAAGGSVPFAPEIAVPALRAMVQRYGPFLYGPYGFRDAFNPTLREPGAPVSDGQIVADVGWFDEDHLGIDQGPILTMIENHRTGLIWELMRESPYIVTGLCRAGFSGGWLEGRC